MDGENQMIPLKDDTLFKQQAFIDNLWVDSAAGDKIPVINPSDGGRLGTVPSLGAEEIDRAVDAAERAFAEWRRQTAKERAVALQQWFRLILENREDVARIISTEVAPFGGMKQSGIGREGSKYGIDEYLEIKYL
jgi:succinate-semialdehyde dehydrogenase/glutarate-semialdehyde dehydrogenase